MTLGELCERVGPDGRIRLSWNKEDGWILVVTTGNSKALVEKTHDDLEGLFERCATALKMQRRT